MMGFVMIVLQLGCMVEAFYRGMSWRGLYWFGAAILTLAVIKGIKT